MGDGFGGAADDPGVGVLFEAFDGVFNEVGIDFGVAVEADEEVALCLFDGEVHGGRYDSFGVVDKDDAIVFLGEFLDDVSGVIVTHAVGDEDFDFIVRVVVLEDALDGAFDEGGFVADGHDHGDERGGDFHMLVIFLLEYNVYRTFSRSMRVW